MLKQTQFPIFLSIDRLSEQHLVLDQPPTQPSSATMAPLNPTAAMANSTAAPTQAESLSQSQDLAIEIIERVGASISIPCAIFLMWTFLANKRLRTPSNTLLFNASPANLFAGIASLIGRAGLSRPNAATCQVQGFFLEWQVTLLILPSSLLRLGTSKS